MYEQCCEADLTPTAEPEACGRAKERIVPRSPPPLTLRVVMWVLAARPCPVQVLHHGGRSKKCRLGLILQKC